LHHHTHAHSALQADTDTGLAPIIWPLLGTAFVVALLLYVVRQHRKNPNRTSFPGKKSSTKEAAEGDPRKCGGSSPELRRSGVHLHTSVAEKAEWLALEMKAPCDMVNNCHALICVASQSPQDQRCEVVPYRGGSDAAAISVEDVEDVEDALKASIEQDNSKSPSPLKTNDTSTRNGMQVRTYPAGNTYQGSPLWRRVRRASTKKLEDDDRQLTDYAEESMSMDHSRDQPPRCGRSRQEATGVQTGGALRSSSQGRKAQLIDLLRKAGLPSSQCAPESPTSEVEAGQKGGRMPKPSGLPAPDDSKPAAKDAPSCSRWYKPAVRFAGSQSRKDNTQGSNSAFSVAHACENGRTLFGGINEAISAPGRPLNTSRLWTPSWLTSNATSVLSELRRSLERPGSRVRI